MTDIPDGLALVIVTSIGAIQAVTLALIGLVAARLGRVRKDTQASRWQLENEHKRPDGTPINVREELDERHGAVIRGLQWLAAQYQQLTLDIGGLRGEVRSLRDEVQDNRDDIEALEDTVNPREKGRKE